MTEAILPSGLTEAQASEWNFPCDLSNAIFSRARLKRKLAAGERERREIHGADMGVAILRETDLTGADLSGVDLDYSYAMRYSAQR